MIHLMICLLPLFFVAGVFVGWRIKKEEIYQAKKAKEAKELQVERKKSFPPTLVVLDGTRD